ncbi:MAG: hypothetical protein SGJ19_16650 [Planctomycetia bacterium]|nr:hypothetical protein [Planctomycetia bacterium]
MPDLPRSDDWLIFHGEASPAEARVYVRLRVDKPEAFHRLRGEITGPFSRYARTLSATTRFDVAVAGREVLAQRVLPDPCFWTPELPYLYQVRLTLERAGQCIWSDERTFGIRRLGVRGRRLYFEAKNWVLRGAFVEELADFDWDVWRELDLAPVVRAPSEAFCAAADLRGVLLGAMTTEDEPLDEPLRRWQRHPSVGLILVDAATKFDPELRRLVPNTIVAAEFAAGSRPLPGWADVALWSFAIGGLPAAQSSPTLAIRRLGRPAQPADLRDGCDFLQRDLAGSQELAGYLV